MADDAHTPAPPERKKSPEGREPPVMGPRNRPVEPKPLDGEPGRDREYDSGADERAPDDPWQDPGGEEPENG